MAFTFSIDVVSQFTRGSQMPMAVNTRIGNIDCRSRHYSVNRFVDCIPDCDSDVILMQDLPVAAVQSLFRRLPSTFRSKNSCPEKLPGRSVIEVTESDKLATLTPRQREVLACIAKGYSVKEAAKLLGVQPKSIDSHMTTIRARLGIRDRVHLALFAVRVGLIEA